MGVCAKRGGLACAWLAAATLAASCTGDIDITDSSLQRPGSADSSGTGGSGASGSAAGSGASGSAPDNPGPMPVRRLTRDELDNTLRDLLADSSQPARALAPEGRGNSGFMEAGVVSLVDAEDLLELAEDVGSRLSARLPMLLGCDAPVVGEDACATSFLTQFGRRAYRRPLEPAELTDLVAYMNSVRTELGYSFLEAMRVVVQAMLQSPAFLYHWELGTEPAIAEAGLVRLNAHETAARLSYFLWGSIPDALLFAAVDEGRFETSGDVEREAQRMLADVKARPTIARFHSEWLRLEKLPEMQKEPALYPAYGEELARSMADSTAQFVARTVLDEDGTLDSLLTSTTYDVNADLADLYGIAGVTGSELVTRSVDAAQRAGLFTQASFLSVNATPSSSHPIKRGHRLFVDLLCGTVSPPPNAIPPVGEPTANMSTRERFKAHGDNACAQGCHSRFDGLGFAFEHYDAIGAYRTTDGGKAVDATGQMTAPSGGAAQSFDGVVELARILAASSDVRRCVSKQWFRFALGRLEVPGDEASLESAYATFAASGYTIRELIVALTLTRSFLYRSPAEGEVLR